ncbi:hypothetical protein AB0N88_37280, partial [Streptomyces sp. NPDC093516]
MPTTTGFGLTTRSRPAAVVFAHLRARAHICCGLDALAERPLAVGDLRVRTDQIGAGYGTLTPETADALSLAARC